MKKSIFGTLLQLESVFLLITGAVSLFHDEKDWWVFMLCATLSFVIGAITISIGKWKARHNNEDQGKYFSRADSFLVVTLTWVLFSIIGMSIGIVKIKAVFTTWYDNSNATVFSEFLNGSVCKEYVVTSVKSMKQIQRPVWLFNYLFCVLQKVNVVCRQNHTD